ncbi:hypothetical protein CLOHYLEM_06685 [[Clostridium] hylemonae DSM 15053]|uniref:Uncharacterized protein n=1 Tax=[Clostridium] hylemonae DSM 15053 TaxID=553973 RepID=C0C3M2_9FIRM|nr:hypothetical protein CLOHYLEM_06685 [[Clostridium] hylemonae DSM 15053]
MNILSAYCTSFLLSLKQSAFCFLMISIYCIFVKCLFMKYIAASFLKFTLFDLLKQV